jgi:signal transduction histidine kinase
MSTDHAKFPILYVDDDRANLLTFCYALEKDFWIFTASSGEEALRRLMEEDVAVLVADQRMPGMTGVEVCARARELKPSVVRMIVTAYADMKAATDAINRGQVSRYITKPWKEDELKAVLKTGIEVFHLQRMMREMELKLLQSERQGAALAVTAELDHEMRHVFQTLSLHMESLAMIAREIADPAQRAQLLDLATDAGAGVQHVRELLTRLHTGAIARVDEPLEADAARVIEMAVSLMRSEISRVGSVEVLVEGRANVAIAPTELAQILLNLLTNACQALPPGDVRHQKIGVRMSVSDGRALLTISDTGAGIAADARDKIFDMYYTTKPGGSGLGLTIVKQIVERRGGDLRVESEPGRGTAVRLSLPLVRD